jgi:hypothetical protein
MNINSKSYGMLRTLEISNSRSLDSFHKTAGSFFGSKKKKSSLSQSTVQIKVRKVVQKIVLNHMELLPLLQG